MIDGRQFWTTKKMMKEHTITFKRLQTAVVVKQKMKKKWQYFYKKKITNLAKK